MAGEFLLFTPLAMQVMAAAANEARSFNHGYMATEHVLCGLVAVTEGGAGQILMQVGVTLPLCRQGIMFIVGRGEEPIGGRIDATPRTLRLIEFAIREARIVKNNQVDTEHLLIGLIREGEGIGSGLLASWGVNVKDVLSAARSAITRRS